MDKNEISSLLSRYLLALDGKKFDSAWQSQFAEDIYIKLPPCCHKGIQGIMEFHQELMVPFERTHHMSSDHLIDIVGDKAKQRANLFVIHSYTEEECRRQNQDTLIAHGVWTIEILRSQKGWQFKSMQLDVVFRDNKLSPSGD